MQPSSSCHIPELPLTIRVGLPQIENESTNRGRFSTRVTSFASYLERTIETRVAIYHGKMDFDTIGPTETNETEKN